jgi:hypothetical protein
MAERGVAMTPALREIEGTWDEIAARAAELKGHRLKVIVLHPEPKVEADRPPPGSIEEVVESLSAQVPDEEWDKLPADLSQNLDHYIYGTTKP